MDAYGTLRTSLSGGIKNKQKCEVTGITLDGHIYSGLLIPNARK
jgi:hypothetical protein